MIEQNIEKTTNELTTIIENAQHSKSKRVRFTLDLTLEEAEFLNSILLEVNRFLVDGIKSHEKQKREAVQRLRKMDDEQKKMFILALKSLRMMRTKNWQIDSACIHVARKYYADFRTLLQSTRYVESIRKKKIESFHNHHIMQLFHAGMTKKEIASSHTISIHKLNKIIKNYSKKELTHESH